MLVYILVFLILLFLKKKYINKLGVFILLLLAIFRYDIGWDYRSYYYLASRYEFLEIPFFPQNIMTYIEKFDWKVWQYYRLEFLNKVIYKVNWFFKFPPQFVIIVYSLITLWFIKKGIDVNIKEKDRKNNIYIFFYTLPLFYLGFLSLLRQGVAVSLVFYSYTFIKQRKLFKFILTVIIASLFHKTALLILPIYFFYNIKINRSLYVAMFIIGLFFDNIFIKLVTKYNIPLISKYRAYVIEVIGEGGTKLFYIILLIGAVILFLTFIDKKFYKKNSFLISMTLIGVFIYCSLISLGHLGPRMSTYFLIYILYLIPEIERSFKKVGINKWLISIFMLVVLILQLYTDSKNSVRSQFVPYKTIFSEKTEFKVD